MIYFICERMRIVCKKKNAYERTTQGIRSRIYEWTDAVWHKKIEKKYYLLARSAKIAPSHCAHRDRKNVQAYWVPRVQRHRVCTRQLTRWHRVPFVRTWTEIFSKKRKTIKNVLTTKWANDSTNVTYYWRIDKPTKKWNAIRWISTIDVNVDVFVF